MSKFDMTNEKYYEKCGTYEISNDIDINGNVIPFIYTERFTAFPLKSSETNFELFSPKINELYNSIFNDSIVVQKYASGSVYSTNQFENIVKLHSSRWDNNYPFAAFMVTDNNNDDIVGYEVIGNCYQDINPVANTGEIAYLFNKNYHRSEKIQNVGLECVGALLLGYGHKQYEIGSNINQIFNQTEQKFLDGTPFSIVYATSRIDNPGSYKLLSFLDFEVTGTTNKWGNERYELSYDFQANDQRIEIGVSLESTTF